jgi:HSP20 family protein
MEDDVIRAGTSREAATQARAATPAASRNVLSPPADIFEHANGITVLLDVPGASKDRLDIQLDRDSLVVEADVEIELPRDTESLYADVRVTHYRRAFSLSGEQLDTESVQASLKDGVLRIDIPKREELRPRKISVSTA